MNSKRLYYRRKGDKIIIEGKQDDQSILIWTLPNPEVLLTEILEKASFFTQEKAAKINEKLQRLDLKGEKTDKPAPKVHLININRTEEKDAESLSTDLSTLPEFPKAADSDQRTREEIEKLAWELIQ